MKSITLTEQLQMKEPLTVVMILILLTKLEKTVEVQDFDTNRWNEFTRGIHFFINRQEAINY